VTDGLWFLSADSACCLAFVLVVMSAEVSCLSPVFKCLSIL